MVGVAERCPIFSRHREYSAWTRRDEPRGVMFAPLQLPAQLPLMVGAQEADAVVGDRRLGRRPGDENTAKILRPAAGHAGDAVEPVCGGHAPGAGLVLPRIGEAPDPCIPHRIR